VPTFVGIFGILVLMAWVVFNRLQFPFVPRSILSIRSGFWFTIAAFFFIGMVGSTTNGLFPTQVLILWAQDPMAHGLFVMSFGLATCLFAPVAGFLFFPRHARWLLAGWTTLLLVVMSTQAIVGQHTAAASTAIAALVGCLHSATIVAATAIVQLIVKHEDLGFATSMTFFFYQAGGVAYGIIDQIMVQNKIKPQIITLVVPALVKAGIPFADLFNAVEAFVGGDISGPLFAGISPPLMANAVEALKTAYIPVFRFVYLVSILFGGIAAVLSFFTCNVDTPVTSYVELRLRGLLPARKRVL